MPVLSPNTPNTPGVISHIAMLQPDLILSFYYRRLLCPGPAGHSTPGGHQSPRLAVAEVPRACASQLGSGQRRDAHRRDLAPHDRASRRRRYHRATCGAYCLRGYRLDAVRKGRTGRGRAVPGHVPSHQGGDCARGRKIRGRRPPLAVEPRMMGESTGPDRRSGSIIWSERLPHLIPERSRHLAARSCMSGAPVSARIALVYDGHRGQLSAPRMGAAWSPPVKAFCS